MTFKIGDDIIMTADSKKGEVNIPDGEYRGRVSNISERYIDAIFDNKVQGFRTFDSQSLVNISYPGMSIRLADPAEEEKNENIAKCSKCNETTKNINTHKCPADEGKGGMLNYIKKPTPSQWIEGRPKEPGNYWVEWESDLKISAITILSGEKGYTGCYHISRHCPIFELPPPPPVAEVEAFGILERIKQINFNSSNSDRELGLAITFYSQQATKENLRKYFKIEGGISWFDEKKNIDQYIYWYHDRHDYKLLFTPAAKDMLGIK